MKRFQLLVVLSCLIVIPAFSQTIYSRPDIFTVNKITWMGLDFSMIKLINPEGFTDPTEIKEKQFWSLNTLILNEPEKYDLKSFFKKEAVDIDLGTIRERNKMPDIEGLVLEIGATWQFDRVVVQDIINQYHPDATEGIGLVFIMESFNKTEDRGYMWVTFFDIATRQVLLAEKMSGETGGFGFRNYWAKTYYNVMQEIGGGQYERWKKQD